MLSQMTTFPSPPGARRSYRDTSRNHLVGHLEQLWCCLSPDSYLEPQQAALGLRKHESQQSRSWRSRAAADCLSGYTNLPAALFYVWEEKKNLSRTVKGPIFHPPHKITREPASFKDSGRRNETPRSETKEFTAHSTAHGHSCFPAPLSPGSSSPGVVGGGGFQACSSFASKPRNPRLRKSDLGGAGGGTGCEHTCPTFTS